MNKQPIQKKDVKFIEIFVLIGVLFFFISIPLFLHSIIWNKNMKYLTSKNVIETQYKKFSGFYITFIIYSILMIISVVLLIEIPIIINIKWLQTILICCCFGLSAFQLFFFIWLIVSLISFKKRRVKLENIERQKIEFLEQKKISNIHFDQESKLYKFMFSLIYLDNYIKHFINKELEKEITKTQGVVLNKKCVILESALSKHTSIIGTTGSGKTTTAKKFIEAAVKNNWNFIFLDGKADKNLENEIKEILKKNKKWLKIWEIKGGTNWNYNPFANKNAEEIITSISESFGYSASVEAEKDSAYYKRHEKMILSAIVPKILKTTQNFSYKMLEKWTDKNWLLQQLNNTEFTNSIFSSNKKEENKKQEINDFIDEINNKWEERILNELNLKLKELKEKINIKGTKSSSLGQELLKDENNYIYFSIPTLTDRINAKAIAKSILEDIRQSAKHNIEKNKKTLIFFDEFGSYASNVLIELLLQGRSYGYCLVLIYQGLAELEKISSEFKENIINNTNTMIVYNINEIKGSEQIANLFGTRKNINETYQTGITELGKGLTGTGTVKVVDEFVFHPNLIKNGLGIGECIVKTIDKNNKKLIYQEVQKVDLLN